MRGADFFTPVSQFFADEGHITFKQEYIFNAFRWAIHYLVQAKLLQVIETVKVPLQAGTLQYLPNNVTEFVDFTQIVRREDRKIMATVSRPQCSKYNWNNKYNVEAYSYDPNTPKILHVYPPVPEGYNGTVDVIASVDPVPKTQDEDINTDNTLSSIVFDLIIYFMASGEYESTSLREIALIHYNSAKDQITLLKGGPILVGKEDKIKDVGN